MLWQVAWSSETQRPDPHRELWGWRRLGATLGEEEGSQKSKPGSGILGRCQESHRRAREFPHLHMGKPVRATDPPTVTEGLRRNWPGLLRLKASFQREGVSLTPALAPSPRPLSPVPGCGFRAQIVGVVVLKANPTPRPALWV